MIHSNPEILSGTPVFVGTRAPVQTLVDYLEGGYSVDEFIESFPSVRREQINSFLNKPQKPFSTASREANLHDGNLPRLLESELIGLPTTLGRDKP